MLIDKAPGGPVQVALGVDPGSPRLYVARLRRTEGVPVLEVCESIEWTDPASARVLADLLEGVEACAIEDQFLSPGLFHEDGSGHGAPGAAGGYFRSLKGLANASGAVAALWALRSGASALRVSHGTWKRLLLPAPQRSRDDARASSLRAMEAFWPGKGPGRKGAWRKSDHDLAAAALIAAWALGVRSLREWGGWPPQSSPM